MKYIVRNQSTNLKKEYIGGQILLIKERRKKILKLLDEREIVEISELTKLLNVSEMTVRRDLDDLQQENKISRIRGGAMKKHGPINTRSSFVERQDAYYNEKKLIGKVAASLIENNESIIFDSGTTTLEVARNINPEYELFTTSVSLQILLELSKYQRNKIFVPGGFINDAKELNIIGAHSTEILSQLSFNKVFLGAWGFNMERGIVYQNLEETILRRIMTSISNQIILVIDSSKFGKDGLVSLDEKSIQVDTIITDEKIPEEYIEFCSGNNIDLLIATQNGLKSI